MSTERATRPDVEQYHEHGNGLAHNLCAYILQLESDRRELVEALREIQDHLFTIQDAARARDLARDALAKHEAGK